MVRRWAGWIVLGGSLGPLGGCNALVGIDDPYDKDSDGGLAADSAASDATDASLEVDGDALRADAIDADAIGSDAVTDDSADAADAVARSMSDVAETGTPAESGKPIEAGCDGSCDACVGASCACEAGATVCAGRCSDTRSDPKNCGQCGLDCSATSATSRCVNSMCVRTCQTGFDDCNHDLALGSQGDGCETDVQSDPQHCGSCLPCAPPPAGVAACSAGVCQTWTISATQGTTSALYGNPAGGSPYSMRCGPGEVVIGLRGLGTTAVFGIGVDCGRLDLVVAASGYSVSETPTSMLPVTGGVFTPPPPSFTMRCPSSTFVSRVAGTTAIYDFGNTGSSEILETLSLWCSSAAVDNARHLTVSSPMAGPSQGTVSAVTTAFDVSCPGGGVNGFVGRSGAAIDEISVSCANASVVVQ